MRACVCVCVKRVEASERDKRGCGYIHSAPPVRPSSGATSKTKTTTSSSTDTGLYATDQTPGKKTNLLRCAIIIFYWKPRRRESFLPLGAAAFSSPSFSSSAARSFLYLGRRTRRWWWWWSSSSRGRRRRRRGFFAGDRSQNKGVLERGAERAETSSAFTF